MHLCHREGLNFSRNRPPPDTSSRSSNIDFTRNTDSVFSFKVVDAFMTNAVRQANANNMAKRNAARKQLS